MWEINVSNQAATFLYSLLLGGLLCLYYDFIRASRKAGLNSFVAVFVTDVIFWVSSAFVTFVFLIARTYGEIRGYVIISEMSGFVLFRLTLSKLIFPVLACFFTVVVKLKNIIIKKTNRFYCWAEAIIGKIFVSTITFLQRLLKSIKKLLKSRHKVLYTNENNTDAEYVLNETKI